MSNKKPKVTLSNFLRSLMFNRTWVNLIIFSVGLIYPCQASYPKLWNIPLANESFVGREKELSILKKEFQQYRKGRKYIVITGMAGIGKTQLAKMFCHKNYKHYDIVWWFDASRDISDQIKKFAEEWNRYNPNDLIPINSLSTDTLVEFVKNKLRVASQKWLVIFDNAKDKTSIEKYLPDKHTAFAGHIIITSKDSSSWHNKITLKEMIRPESIELLRKHVGNEDQKILNLLAENLDDYPLALMQAATYIKLHPFFDTHKYNEMFKDHYENDGNLRIRDNGDFLDNYSMSVEATLKLSFDSVKDANLRAYNLLILFSHLGSRDCPERLIQEFAKITGSEGDYSDLISDLLKHSLIEINKRKKPDGTLEVTYNIHEIVQKIAKKHTDPVVAKEQIRLGIKAFLKLLDLNTEEMVQYLLEKRNVLFHAQNLIENADLLEIQDEYTLALKVRLLECYLTGLRNFDLAEKELMSIEKIVEKIGFSSKLTHALYLINKGNYHGWKSAEYDKAIEHMGLAFEVLEKLEGCDDEKLRAFTNTAQMYCVKGEITSARRYVDSVDQYEKSTKSNAYKALYRMARAMIHIEEGLFEDALKETLIAENFLVNVQHPPLSFSQQIQKSEILMKLDKNKEALSVATKIYEASKKFFQTDDHAIPARAMIMLSKLKATTTSRYKEPIKILKKAIFTFDKTYKGTHKHSTQAFAHRILGDILYLDKQYKEAFKEYEISEQIYDQVHSAKEAEGISDLYKSLALLGIDLKDDYIARKYFKKHIEVFGADHPRTAEIMKVLDRHEINFS